MFRRVLFRAGGGGGLPARAAAPPRGGALVRVAAAAPHVEDALAPEPAEHAAEVFDPHRVQLVQPGERPRVAPPQARDPVYQALVLLGLRETAEAGGLVGHEQKSQGGGEVGGAWWGGPPG